uniref:AT-rich interaction domain 4A n=1 Tax=Amazona collaria TaxID=241587 RepID=A0A8B9FND4_9PSIT
MKAADEPAYLTVGTDVSAKYRGAFCEAKIKTVKRLVKVKVVLKGDNSTQLVQDDQVKGPLRVGAMVETKMPDGSFQEAVISKLTDASWYTVVFDDGDERTLRRTSLCLKGERHFAESETLDQLPLTNPEHFGTPVIGKKSNRGRRSSLPVTEDEKEEESSEEEDEDKRRLNDELLGKVVSVSCSSEKADWYPALVVSPSCNDDITVKKDQCLIRSFADSKFYSVARKDIKELDVQNLPKSESSPKKGLQEASTFLSTKAVPRNWKMDISEILESSSSDEEDGAATGTDEEELKREEKTEEVVPEEELDPEERDNFLQQLYKFMEDRGNNYYSEDDKTQDKLKDSNKENKDIEEMPENAEKKENETPLGRKSTPKQKEKKIKKQEDSDKESDEEEERHREREEIENKGESEGEEDEEDAEPCLTGTKVKVKYGRGKTQKIYEASIKSTEIDDGEVLYLVHYYGWNVRYDEWVKADRIIWPVDKGGPKRKQKKKTKNKEDSEKDEKKDEEKQKSKRGRPPLKSTLPSNTSCSLSKTPTSEGKSGARNSGSSDSEADETSEKNLNEEFSPETSELDKSEKLHDEKLDEENPKIPHALKENDRTQVQPLETLKLEVEESEQIVQTFGNRTEQIEEIKREAEKSPKGKGRRSKTKDPSLENAKISPGSQEEVANESLAEPERLDMSSLDCKEISSTTESETEHSTKDKKLLKRKTLEQASPEKRNRRQSEMEVPNIVSEERTNECTGAEECRGLNAEESLRTENEEMPSLVAESVQHAQELRNEISERPSEEDENVPLKDEDDAMPQIGPETLLCHEVDLDDLDEKEKSSSEDIVSEKPDPSASNPNLSALPAAVQSSFSVISPLTLSQDESRSIKSESDMTIEVDSVAEESQEGLCESESANGFEASTTSSTCSLSVQEREIGEKGQKRPSDSNSGTLAKKQKRTPKRTSAAAKNEKNGTGQSSDSEDLSVLDSSSKCTPVKHINASKPQKISRSPARVISPHIKDGEKDKHREKHHHQNASSRVYKWSFQLNELDNMSSTERISFLQEKLQEIRKYYMSLKSEVATIDRRRKRLKKKDREVSHTGASMSSASSDTGMSPSSSSPPQNVLAVECR